MKIGYPCINNSINCTPNRTFRLRSYSKELMIEKIGQNIDCLEKTLNYNIEHGLLFFRIGSGLIPFASHEICDFNWRKHFKKDFSRIGSMINKNKIRISMHPDQFVVLNSKKKDVVEKSIKEIDYHCNVLDTLNLDEKAKVQIHVGGLFNDREKSKKRFIEVYDSLSKKQKKRLVIENDDRLFSVKDCLDINRETNIPIIFDSFHHQCLNHKESFSEAFSLCAKTWKTTPMVDYSSQYPNGRKGRHVYSIDMKKFSYFVKQIGDADIMLEIKDKEKSALKAFNYLQRNNYL